MLILGDENTFALLARIKAMLDAFPACCDSYALQVHSKWN